MKPIYKISIIITCLISIFFFTKWLYKVWPRYEWKEKIVIVNYYYQTSKNKFFAYSDIDNFLGRFNYCKELCEIKVCYKKERVKIN